MHLFLQCFEVIAFCSVLAEQLGNAVLVLADLHLQVVHLLAMFSDVVRQLS